MINLNLVKANPSFSGIQREQKENQENKPVLKQLQRDTVSFKANEGLFLEAIGKFCKKRGDVPSSVLEDAQAYAHDVVKTDARIVAERARIEKDKSIPQDVKDFLFDEIWSQIGIGGGRDLGGPDKVTRFLDKVFGH